MATDVRAAAEGAAAGWAAEGAVAMRGRRVVIVGASSGIGWAAAAALRARGADLVLVARDAARLEAAAERLRTVSGGEVASVRADAADAAALADALTGVASRAAVDHVLLTAGTAALGAPLEARPVEAQLAPVHDRLRGALAAVRALAPRMRAGGSFVFTGGLSTDRPVKGAWATSVGTAAVEQLARALALELAPLRVNAVSPGWTDTPMWDDVLGEGKAGVFREVAARTPVGRLVAAHEVAEAAVFLMTNGAITGEVLHVDGGQRLT